MPKRSPMARILRFDFAIQMIAAFVIFILGDLRFLFPLLLVLPSQKACMKARRKFSHTRRDPPQQIVQSHLMSKPRLVERRPSLLSSGGND
jgi:hypothetical protein